MPVEWRPLGELAADEPGAIAIGPFGSRMKSDVYVSDGVRVIRGNNITKSRALKDDWVYVTAEFAEKIQNCMVQPGDLVFPHRGAIGEVALIEQRHCPMVLSSSMMKFRPDPQRVNAQFLYYFFRSAAGRSEILRFASQVGTPGIGQPLTSLRQFQVPLMTLGEQSAIAKILSDLDDKIELNRRMNVLLEGMARAIFKAWFIDFEPVKAKTSGATSFPGMPQPVFDQLPNQFVDSELGEIPEGWEIMSISELCTVGRGGSPRPINNFMGGTVPWVKIADATASTGPFIFETKERLKEAGVSKSVKVQPGDLILSNSATCGIPMFVELHGCIHDGWLHFRGLKRVSKLFLFHALEHLTEHLVRIADGSVQKNLNTKLVGQQHFAIPPSYAATSFDSVAGSYFRLMRNAAIESRALMSIRDALLPKLISGELAVPVTNGGDDG